MQYFHGRRCTDWQRQLALPDRAPGEVTASAEGGRCRSLGRAQVDGKGNVPKKAQAGQLALFLWEQRGACRGGSAAL
jgi:hypothetical protein